MFCQVTNPIQLWHTNWKLLLEDNEYRIKHAFGSLDYIILETDLKNCVLIALEDLFNKNCSSLSEFRLLMPNQENIICDQDNLMHEEINYNLFDL